MIRKTVSGSVTEANQLIGKAVALESLDPENAREAALAACRMILDHGLHIARPKPQAARPLALPLARPAVVAPPRPVHPMETREALAIRAELEETGLVIFMQSKIEGTCSSCFFPIEQGSLIAWYEALKKATHAQCAEYWLHKIRAKAPA